MHHFKELLKIFLSLEFLKMKKFVSITFVLTAYCLLLLHSVISHHHHQEEFAQHHDASGSHDDDDNDIDNNFLSSAFSLLQHDNGGAIVYESVSTTCKCTKVKVVTDVFFHEDPVIRKPDKPPLIYSDHTVFHFSSSFTDMLQLRGPPVPMG